MRDLNRSEKNHLKAFVDFIKSDAFLWSAIIQKDWLILTFRYNDPIQNGYDEKNKEAL